MGLAGETHSEIELDQFTARCFTPPAHPTYVRCVHTDGLSDLKLPQRNLQYRDTAGLLTQELRRLDRRGARPP